MWDTYAYINFETSYIENFHSSFFAGPRSRNLYTNNLWDHYDRAYTEGPYFIAHIINLYIKVCTKSAKLHKPPALFLGFRPIFISMNFLLNLLKSMEIHKTYIQSLPFVSFLLRAWRIYLKVLQIISGYSWKLGD